MGKVARKTNNIAAMQKPKLKPLKKGKVSVLPQARLAKNMKQMKKLSQKKLEEEDEDDGVTDSIDDENDSSALEDENDDDIGTELDAKDESVEDQELSEDEEDTDGSAAEEDSDESAEEDECEQEDEENGDLEEEEENGDLSEEEENEGSSGDDVHDHKAALERLKNTDPEFYKFLQENDKKLLQFNVSDSEDSEEETEHGNTHIPAATLEVASDESDFDDEAQDGEAKANRHLSLKMIKAWQQELQTVQKSNKTIVQVTNAFNATLRTISPEADSNGAYVIKDSAVFNSVVQLCVLYLGPAVRSFLQLKKGQQAHKSKRFTKIKSAMKQYFTDLHALLSNVTSGNILNVLLKHLHYMTPILTSFPTSGKAIIKKLIVLWGSASEESVRVVAFLCILRLVNLQRETMLDYVLKTMYITYVKNAKFVSVNTLPSINFMRRSLVEIYALDAAAAYQHVFLYVRQLAINLRNAIVDNKKENVHIVYNWQFVNSCKLWGNFLGQAGSKPQVQGLIYPFVQVCLGTLKLVPTAAYFPLRFHLVQVLMDLSRDTGVFIPVLPFLTEILTTFDFNKKHAKVSMKPLSFTTALRMGKSQMSENGFKDAIIDSLYDCLLEYLAAHSHSIAFPDLALFAKCQIKLFLKKCSVAKYQRKLQQLLEKVDANVAHIETERAKLTCGLGETKKIEGFEAQIKNRGTPLSGFFDSWCKVRSIKRSKQATNNEEVGDYNLPVLYKKAKGAAAPRKNVDSSGKVVLFPSDSEDDDAESEAQRPKRGKRAGAKTKSRAAFVPGKPALEDDAGDLVEDIVDW